MELTAAGLIAELHSRSGGLRSLATIVLPTDGRFPRVLQRNVAGFV